jgi:hypothetical protein
MAIPPTPWSPRPRIRSLSVHDDRVLVRALAEDLGHAVQVIGRDPRPARPSQDVAELLARPAHRGGVDDRQELVEVLGEQSIEEGRVAVLERGQADVPLQVVVLDPQVFELERHLLVDREDARRQQTVEPERIALVVGEGEILGQQPTAQQGRTRDADVRRSTGECHRMGRAAGARHQYGSRMEPLPPGFRWRTASAAAMPSMSMPRRSC